MAPRTRLSADERRQQLIVAVIAVLDEDGFRAATADAIAQQAGVSKGLLWHYFEDLDALFEATARSALNSQARAVALLIDLEAPAPDVIRAAIHAAVRVRETHRPERRAIAQIVVNLRDARGKPVLGQEFDQEVTASQADIFRRGQESGDFRRDLDPELVAITYAGAVEGMLSHLDENPDVDGDVFADTVADVLLNGLG